MKKRFVTIVALVTLAAVAGLRPNSQAADEVSFQKVEFLTVRWQGRENTCVIRPNGNVEKLRPLFERVKRPEGIDERAFYMSIVMNTLAREGYELAALTNDELVM